MATAAPPGFVCLDNLGDPAFVRVARIAAVYRATERRKTMTHVVLSGMPGERGGSFTLLVHDGVKDVGAAITAAIEAAR
jgi:hypothetical protein